jgi:hypothetical protein
MSKKTTIKITNEIVAGILFQTVEVSFGHFFYRAYVFDQGDCKRVPSIGRELSQQEVEELANKYRLENLAGKPTISECARLSLYAYSQDMKTGQK